jgi:LysM repeat protein
MRTQTIAALFDGQEWLAEPVDPAGWLAGPATNVDDRPGGFSDGLLAGQQDATSTQEVAGRRADGARDGRTASRSPRRSGRVRHLRRVRTESLRSGVVSAGAPARRGARQLAVDQVDGLEVVESPAVPLPAAESAATQSTAEGYQMGRWARLTLTVTVLAAIVVVVVSLTTGPATPAMVDVTVAPGDTLWSIAEQAAPDRDPRDVIEEIRQLNDMQGGVLPIGVVLRVPAAAS